MALVWEHEFPYNQQLIMLSLADHANDLGERIFPSIARIAWKTGYSERQAGRLILELKKIGVLVVVKKAYRHRPTEYKIDWSKATRKEKFRYDNLTDLEKLDTTSDEISKDISEVREDIAMSPKPSLIKPSLIKPSENNKFTNDIKNSMVFVLADVTGIDAGIPKNFSRLASDAKDLFKGGYSATDISNAFSSGGPWYKTHWKGKKGQKPNTGDIRSSIKDLRHTKHCGCEECGNKYTEGEYSEFIE